MFDRPKHRSVGIAESCLKLYAMGGFNISSARNNFTTEEQVLHTSYCCVADFNKLLSVK